MAALAALIIAMTAQTDATAQNARWHNYLSYNDITDVKQGSRLMFVLASGALYSYNPNDQSIQTFDKADALNDCNIQMIEWCGSAKRLVVVYQNSNIDLMDEKGNVVNMPELHDKTMTDDKTVYGLDIEGRYGYLCTGFGVMKLDVANAEVVDTYKLGFRVDYCYTANGYIYAASSIRGVYKASLKSNLLDPKSWSYDGSYTPRNKQTDPELLEIAKTLKPGGPKYNYFNYMYFAHGRLYTSGGGIKSGSELRRPGCVQVLNKGEWTIYQDDFKPAYYDQYLDVTGLAVDPGDPEHVFACNSHCGMFEFKNGKMINNFTPENSAITPIFEGNHDYVRTNGPVFDRQGNLFLLNTSTPEALIEFTKDRQWTAKHHAELFLNSNSKVSLGLLQGSILDSRGLIWFCNNHSTQPGVFCYDPLADKVVVYEKFVNQDGSVLSNVEGVRAVAEDLDGSIWAATSTGPLLLNSQQMADNTLGFTQVKVPRNDGTNYADYLLTGVDITAVAVDGGGRKWFGTAGNGVYLISADNMTQIHHFTAENTPLLSDNIESVAIDGTTGEVFFGTGAGLCSYLSDATQPSQSMSKDNVYAYPNPVKPGYTGLITVTGLTLDADVKITTSNGSLVAEGRSTGGTFSWDGTDLSGKRVASGIYMVNTATSTGGSGTVCKIAIVN